MKEPSRLPRYVVGGKWFLFIAAAGWVGCSFDSSKLGVSANHDASSLADLRGALPDVVATTDSLQDGVDLPIDGPVIADGASAPEFEVLPDTPVLLPPDGAAPSDFVLLPDLVTPSDDGVVQDGVAPPLVDSSLMDAGRADDAPQTADVPAGVLGDSGTDSPFDTSKDVRDAATEADSAAAVDTADAAPICGGPGQTCCAGNACSNSGCCVGGFCTASGSICPSPLLGTCSNGACGTCGGSSGACCASSSCTAPHTLCQTTTFPASTTCAACGGGGEPCCPGNFCLDGGCCIPPLSGSGTATCKAAGLQCSPGITATCSANVCGACGGLGNPCCANSRCTAPNTFCQAATPSTCVGCGGAGQPCCPNPTSGETATCSPGLTCQTGTGSQTGCVACGGSGQPCCAGSVCTTGTCKVSGTCP
jgi:hypothetical protein